jgi:hypothetical protein
MMKITTTHFIAIACLFSISCFGQQDSKTSLVAVNTNTYVPTDDKSSEDLIVEAYIVEETINMKFGKSVTKYKVSKLDMINTHSLGPNNTRTVTPIYKKTKAKRTVYSKDKDASATVINQ